MGKLTKNLSQNDAAAKALAAQGRAAILSPDGSGQAEAVWAWAAAHPGVPLVWLTCSEERRALRTAEARQQGRAQEASVQLVCASQLENYTPAQWVELAAQRPGLHRAGQLPRVCAPHRLDGRGPAAGLLPRRRFTGAGLAR